MICIATASTTLTTTDSGSKGLTAPTSGSLQRSKATPAATMSPSAIIASADKTVPGGKSALSNNQQRHSGSSNSVTAVGTRNSSGKSSSSSSGAVLTAAALEVSAAISK